MLGGIFGFLFSACFQLAYIHCICRSRFLKKKVEIHCARRYSLVKEKVVRISGTEFEIAQFLFEYWSRGWNGVLTSINTHTRPITAWSNGSSCGVMRCTLKIQLAKPAARPGTRFRSKIFSLGGTTPNSENQMNPWSTNFLLFKSEDLFLYYNVP
jgi:hypothetical protein